MTVVSSGNSAALTVQAHSSLEERLRAQRGKPTLFLSAAGSAFTLLDDISSDVLGSWLTVGVLDERYSVDSAVNNCAQFMDLSFFSLAREQGCFSIDTRVLNGESMESFSGRFEHVLRAWYDAHAGGAIIATMGMGSDGHTAGVMPYPERQEWFSQTFDTTPHWVCAYDASGKHEYSQRVTTTFPFFRMINETIVYCTGSAKRDALRRALAADGTCAQTPARIWREMKNVTLYTDIVALH